MNQKMDLSNLPNVKGARFDSHHNKHEPLCLQGTQVEILSSINSWVEDPDPQGRCIFWLRGLAGTGKSTISRTVARELSKKPITVISFFFKKGEGDRARTAHLFTTIAHQLVQALPDVAPFISQAIEEDPHISDKVLSCQFQELILTPLARIEKSSSSAIVVILDALDECDDQQHVTTLINLLSKAKQVQNLRLRFFITSRLELPIQLGFKKLGCEYENVALHEVPVQDIKRDISAYFNVQLQEIRETFNCEVSANTRLPKSWPSGDLINQLTEMSVPLFIFASTVCRFIDDRDCGSPVIQTENFVINYKDMDESNQMFMPYLPILNQMLVKRGDSGPCVRSVTEKATIIERFRHIVGSMVLLADPLSAESLSKIIGMNLATVEIQFNKLHSVLNVPTDSSVPVRLFHLSFRDFLVEAGSANQHPFQVDGRKTHEALALKCLELLSRDNNLRQDICQLKHPGTLRSEIDQRRIDACIPPYIRYACLFWVYHLKRSDRLVCDGSPVHVFLTTYLLNWLEVISLLDRTSESLHMIDDLMSIVEGSTGHQVSKLLYDAKRVVLSHRYIISTAPLQLYSSVLLFSPQNSVVAKHYKETIPDWIDIQPAVTRDWDPCLQTVDLCYCPKATTFSHDQALIATISDFSVDIWRTDTGACIQILSIPDSCKSLSMCSLKFSADDKLLYLATNRRELLAWHTDTWEFKHQVALRASDIMDSSLDESQCIIAFSNDARLVSVENRAKLELYEVDTGQCLKHFEFGDTITALAYTHDMSQCLIGFGCEKFFGGFYYNASLRNTHAETQSQLVIRSISCAAFSLDSQIIAAKSYSELQLYELDENEYKKAKSCACSVDFEQIVFSQDSKLFAGIGSSEIHIFEVKTLQCIQRFENRAYFLGFSGTSFCFSHDSTFILVACDSFVTRFDLTYNREIERRDIADDDDDDDDDEESRIVTAVEFSADFQLLLCKTRKSGEIIWVETGTCLDSAPREAFGIQNCPWAILVDNYIKIWQSNEESHHCIALEIPEELHRMAEMPERPPLFLSQDFALLAAIMCDYSICIWKCDTGELILKEEMAKEDIEFGSLEFSPDSSLALLYRNEWTDHATFGLRSTSKATLWQLNTGKATIDSPKTAFLGFSPDSSLVLIHRQSFEYADGIRMPLYTGTLELLSTETGHTVHKFGKLNAKRDCRSHSFSGPLLALSSWEFIEIWNLETKSLIQLIPIGNQTEIISFALNNTCLITTFGLIDLEIDPNQSFKVDMASTEYDTLSSVCIGVQGKALSRQGLCFGDNFRWILWNGKRLLWIPVGYEQDRYRSQPGRIIWSPSRVVLENPVHELAIIGFSIEQVQSLFSEI